MLNFKLNNRHFGRLTPTYNLMTAIRSGYEKVIDLMTPLERGFDNYIGGCALTSALSMNNPKLVEAFVAEVNSPVNEQ